MGTDWYSWIDSSHQ